MQLVDSKLYIANVRRRSTHRTRGWVLSANLAIALQRRQPLVCTCRRETFATALISLAQATSASERLLALVLAAFVVTASPALVATVRSTVSLSLQILLQAGHVGLIAFQIFGR